jgi:hypothetical protein
LDLYEEPCDPKHPTAHMLADRLRSDPEAPTRHSGRGVTGF